MIDNYVYYSVSYIILSDGVQQASRGNLSNLFFKDKNLFFPISLKNLFLAFFP